MRVFQVPCDNRKIELLHNFREIHCNLSNVKKVSIIRPTIMKKEKNLPFSFELYHALKKILCMTWIHFFAVSFRLAFSHFWASPMAQWVKNPPAMQETQETGSGRCPGGGNDDPLQYSCLGNPMDRGAWRATESDMTEQRLKQQAIRRVPGTKQVLLKH